jgi:hypothetical protein
LLQRFRVGVAQRRKLHVPAQCKSRNVILQRYGSAANDGEMESVR